MKFNSTLPEWGNEGIAPSENLRTNGFQVGDRPAAATFNWFWSKVPKAVTEIQDSLNNVEKNVNNSFSKIESSLGMTKSKNLLKNTAGTTTQNGITFTYNDDGSVTCNGTATADANYIYTITLPQNASFILSGCPTGGSKSTYSLFARDTATWSIVYFDTGSSRTVKTGNYTTWQVVIRISNGQTVNDMTFYPMLRNADIYADDAEYEPYSDDLQTQINEINAMTEDSGWKNLTGGVYYRKYGKCVEIRGEYAPSSAGGGFTLGTLPPEFRPSKSKAVGAFTNDTASKVYRIVAGTDGQVVISGENQNAFTANTAYNLHLSFLLD